MVLIVKAGYSNALLVVSLFYTKLNPTHHFPDVGAFVETWIGVPEEDMIPITNMD